jgi:hypothetical protein
MHDALNQIAAVRVLTGAFFITEPLAPLIHLNMQRMRQQDAQARGEIRIRRPFPMDVEATTAKMIRL